MLNEEKSASGGENEVKPNYSTLKEEPINISEPPPAYATHAHPFPKFLPKKIAALILILIILALGLSGATYLFGKNSTGNQNSIPVLNPTSISKISPTTTPDFSKNWAIEDSEINTEWKKYTYSNSGFSFEAPKDWKFIANYDKDNAVIISLSSPERKIGEYVATDGSSISIYFQKSMYSNIDEWRKQSGIGNGLQESESINYILDNIKAITFEYNYEGNETSVNFINNGLLYDIRIGYAYNKTDSKYLAHKKIFNQILSTFKFTESSVGDLQILSDATKELGENYALVKINTLYGENYALGSARFENGFGGLEFVAHKENGSWKIIHKGTESPGCSKFTNYPDFPKKLCSPEY